MSVRNRTEASDLLVSRAQIAARWAVSIETVKRRERAGSLTPLRFNQRLLRYRLSEVIELEDAARGAATCAVSAEPA